MRGAAVSHVQCHGLVRLKAGNARIAGLCAVALCLTAFLAIGGPQIGASGTLCEPQNATTCSRGGPRGGADARTTCAVASGSQEALVARSCSSVVADDGAALPATSERRPRGRCEAPVDAPRCGKSCMVITRRDAVEGRGGWR